MALFQIFLNVAIGGLQRYRADGSRPEDVGRAKQLKGIAVGTGLVFPGEVQVDVRYLVAAKAQKGLEGDVEAVFFIGGAADGAHRVGHICAAVIAVFPPIVKVSMLAVGATVVGRQRVDLGNTGEEGHDGRADGATGTNQITVLQRVLHQLLGGHIDHIVMTAQNVPQLGVDPVHDDLRRLFTIELMGLVPDQVAEDLGGVFDGGREQPRGKRPHPVAPVGDHVGVGDHHFPGLLFPQIGKFRQHFVSGAQIEGVGGVGVLKALGV